MQAGAAKVRTFWLIDDLLHFLSYVLLPQDTFASDYIKGFVFVP